MLRCVVLVPLLLSAYPAAASAPGRDAAFEEFVAGRYAWGNRELGTAATRYGAALAADPDSPLLKRRAFEVALAAGDIRRARKLAAGLSGDAESGGTVALLRLADAMAAKKWDVVDAEASRLGEAGFQSIVAPVARAWALSARGGTGAAAERLAPTRAPAPIKSYLAEQRARVIEAGGDANNAADAWRAAVADLGVGGAGSGLRIRAAAAAERAGDGAGALRVLEAATGAAVDAARARLEAGRPLGIKPDTPATGLAALYARLGAEFAQGRQITIALQLTRLSVYLAPKSDQARLLLAELLGRDEQPERGLAELDRTDPKSLFAEEAEGLRALLLDAAGREKEALALLTSETSARGASAADWIRLGEYQRGKDKYIEAANAYTRALELTPDTSTQRWTIYFLRGGAFEQAGDWARAEPDLRAAYTAAPEQAIVLNYLGYGLLDRGEKLEEAERLIRRAAAAAPNNAAIIDSLGWAYFRTGRFPQAVESLEKAVAGAPGDPTINEHLGDAYWAVGRRLEARFRWRAAAQGEPDDAQKTRLSAKLDWGMDKAALAQKP